MSAEEIVSQVDQLAKASGNHTANDSQQGRSVGGQGTGPSSDPKAQKRNFLLAQARHVDTAPLPDQARHDSVLRANPYPEVTDRICRLPLPTLFYRLEAIDLGDLLRIWVRAGAGFLVALSRIFKVRREDPDTAVTAVLFAFQTLSPC